MTDDEAPGYHGVPVPRDLDGLWHRNSGHWWRAGVEDAEQAGLLVRHGSGATRDEAWTALCADGWASLSMLDRVMARYILIPRKDDHG